MKEYILTCSVDGININHEATIKSETPPGFWECYIIAQAAGCDFFHLSE